MIEASNIAEQRVNELDSIIRDHNHAMERYWPREECLSLAIEAFRWVERAKQEAVAAFVSKDASADSRRQRVEQMYRLWLSLVDCIIAAAEKVKGEFSFQNLPEVLEIRAQADAYLMACDMESLHKPLVLSAANGSAFQSIKNG